MNIADKVLNDKYYGKINKEKVDWGWRWGWVVWGWALVYKTKIRCYRT